MVSLNQSLFAVNRANGFVRTDTTSKGDEHVASRSFNFEYRLSIGHSNCLTVLECCFGLYSAFSMECEEYKIDLFVVLVVMS